MLIAEVKEELVKSIVRHIVECSETCAAADSIRQEVNVVIALLQSTLRIDLNGVVLDVLDREKVADVGWVVEA